MKKIGLVLGGGGARGCAHIGVIKALNESGIKIHCVAGTSIGALVGGVYASGGIQDLENYFKQIKWKDVVKQFDPVLMQNGIFGGKKVVKLLNRLIGEKTFKNCKVPFIAVATDLVTGKEIYLQKGRLDTAIRASISLPAIFTSVKKGKYHLVDGGLINPLPVNVVRKMGAEVVIAVDLNHEYITERRKNNLKPNSNKLNIVNLLKPSYPNIIDVIESSIFLMQDQLTQKNLEKNPSDLLLNLKLSSASLFDFHKANELIEAGYKQMWEKMRLVKKISQ